MYKQIPPWQPHNHNLRELKIFLRYLAKQESTSSSQCTYTSLASVTPLLTTTWGMQLLHSMLNQHIWEILRVTRPFSQFIKRRLGTFYSLVDSNTQKRKSREKWGMSKMCMWQCDCDSVMCDSVTVTCDSVMCDSVTCDSVMCDSVTVWLTDVWVWHVIVWRDSVMWTVWQCDVTVWCVTVWCVTVTHELGNVILGWESNAKPIITATLMCN